MALGTVARAGAKVSVFGRLGLRFGALRVSGSLRMGGLTDVPVIAKALAFDGTDAPEDRLSVTSGLDAAPI